MCLLCIILLHITQNDIFEYLFLDVPLHPFGGPYLDFIVSRGV